MSPGQSSIAFASSDGESARLTPTDADISIKSEESHVAFDHEHDGGDVSPCLISAPDLSRDGSEAEASRARAELRRRFAAIDQRAGRGASASEIADETGMPFARIERILEVLAFVRDLDQGPG